MLTNPSVGVTGPDRRVPPARRTPFESSARFFRVALALGVAVVVAGAIAGTAKSGSVGDAVQAWSLVAAFWIASASCLWRARLDPTERLPWLAFGFGLFMYGLGSVIFNLWLADDPDAPFPSISDWMWLCLQISSVTGLVLLGRVRRLGMTRGNLLDGLIASLALTSLCAAIVYQPIFDEVLDEGIAFGLVMPLADLVVVSAVIAGISLRGWRVTGTLASIGSGFLMLAFADVVYTIQAATDGYATGSWLDVPFAVGTALVGLSAWFPARPPRRAPRWGFRSLAIPLLAGVCGVTVTAVMVFAELNPVAEVSTVLLMLCLVVRLGGSMSAYGRVLERSRNEALTDPLTGLANRRHLLADLDSLDPSRRTALVIFDLDGFKGFNDTHGHAAGDELLASLGHELDLTSARWGRGYRMGGDEFCLLVDADSADEAVAAAVDALTTKIDGIPIGCSWGQVVIPDEASADSDALREADQRMYAMKARQPKSARSQLREALSRILHVRDPDLHDHVHDVGRLAAAVARGFGLDDQTILDIVDAAHLHDIGKLALPEQLLHKAGPLDEEEWKVMKTHTLLGEQLLSGIPALATVARVVRSSHERWDGGGYPDGLRGEQIPIGARIILVCDAYDAMVTDRSYRPALGHAAAVEELRRHAGSQFDADVVEMFLRLLSMDELREPEAVVVGHY
jgi:two-component system cell cycle response regulator